MAHNMGARKNTVVTNGVWNAFGNVVNIAIGIFGSLMVVRTLTPSSYGTLSYYLWLSSVIVVFGLLAFPHGHTKIVSELKGEGKIRSANQLSAWSTGMVLLLNTTIALGVGGYAVICERGIDKTYLLIVASMLIPSTLATMIGSRLMVFDKYKWCSIGTQISSVIQLGMLTIAMTQKWGPTGYAFGLLGPGLFQMLFLLIGDWSSIGIYRNLFRIPERGVLRKYVTFLIPMTLVVLYERVIWDRSEILFLKIFSTPSQIGYYNLGYTTFGMFLNVGLALINGYWPSISKDYGAGDFARIREKVKKGILLSVVYAVPLAFGGVVTLQAIIRIVYGAKMLPAADVTMILVIGLIPGVLNGMFSLTLSACGLVWVNVKTGLFTSAISLILDLLLVGHLGAIGGAIGCAMSQTINCLILWCIVVRRLKVYVPWKRLMGVVAIGAFATLLTPAVLYMVSSGIIALVTSVLGGGVLYALSILKFGYLKSIRE